MVPQEISCLQHKVLLPCLSPSSGNTSTTTDNTTDTASSSATPGNYERSLHQPFRRGLLLSRNRSQAALCPPCPEGTSSSGTAGNCCGSLEHGQGRSRDLSSLVRPQAISFLYVCADRDTDAAVLLLQSSAGQAIMGSTIRGCWVSLPSLAAGTGHAEHDAL